MALSADDKKSSLETEDLIVPIAATLISIGGSGYACFDANRKKQSDPKYRAIFIVALIVLILSGLMALEIVIGPLVGHFTKKR